MKRLVDFIRWCFQDGTDIYLLFGTLIFILTLFFVPYFGETAFLIGALFSLFLLLIAIIHLIITSLRRKWKDYMLQLEKEAQEIVDRLAGKNNVKKK